MLVGTGILAPRVPLAQPVGNAVVTTLVYTGARRAAYTFLFPTYQPPHTAKRVRSTSNANLNDCRLDVGRREYFKNSKAGACGGGDIAYRDIHTDAAACYYTIIVFPRPHLSSLGFSET